MNHSLIGNRTIEIAPKLSNFKLHSHDTFELYFFLKGNADYIVEGTQYSLQPYDIILIMPNEMHRAYHKSPAEYDRVVFSITTDFFTEHNCTEYMSVFMNRELGTKNKIPAQFVQESGLSDIIMKWLDYTSNGETCDSALSHAVFIEILHILNHISPLYEKNDNNLVRDVIAYINKNYTKRILLDDLAEEFFVSKYYLCRLFKKTTGYTIINYINNKRIDMAKELIKTGMNITTACTEVGFASYSAYYKAVIKKGLPPV